MERHHSDKLASQKLRFTVSSHPSLPNIEGHRLSTDNITTSFFGQSLARVYETAPITAQVLWASRMRELKTTEEVGGKGAGKQKRISYTYFVGLSYSLAEEIDAIVIACFDGKPRDLADFEATLYTGIGNTVDPVIEAIEGNENVTEYLRLSHMFFDDFSLSEHFGNRIPQLRCIARRSLRSPTLPELLRAILADDGIGIDVSRVPDRPIRGASFSGISSPRSRFWTIAAPHLVDLVEASGGNFTAIPRFGLPEFEFDWGDMPVDQAGQVPFKIRRAGPATIPARVHLAAPDPARDYEEVPIIQSATDEGEVAEFRTTEVLTETESLALANAARMDAIARGTVISGALPPRALLTGVGVGSIILLNDKDGRRYDCQIVSASYQGKMHFEAEVVLPIDPYFELGLGSNGFAVDAGCNQ